VADGSLIFDTKLDNSGLKKGLSIVGSVSAVAFKAIGTGIGVATGAVAALTKAAVGCYAEYEQLTGGVETLFKSSGDTVMEYANNAYKTAGMSANEYMSTITGFSAAMISSLGGDTQKAAEYSNQAVTDMSDNANKMGTSIDSIQQTYASLSRGNFAMLDNLKLGYGGTKEEMQRLLSDAEKLTGKKFDVSNFADITEAIHAVQTEMGITGTTAKEAGTTIEGSMNMAKASWQNLLTGLADGNADLDGLIDNFVQSVVTVGENLLPVVQQSIEGIAQLAESLLPQIAEMIPGLIESTLPGLLTAGTSIILTLIQGIVDSLPTLIPVAVQIVMQLINGLLPLLPQILSAGLQILLQLAMGIAQALPQLIPTIVDIVLQIVETLVDNIDLLIDASIQLMLGLTEGLINAIPLLIEKAPTIIQKLVSAIVKNAGKLVEASFQMMNMLGKGIIDNLPKLLVNVVKLNASIIKGLESGLSDIKDMGVNLVKGLWEGMSNNIEWIKSKVADFANKIIETAKKALGIHSPSKEFAWIGKMCIEGFDGEMEDYNPYDTLQSSMKANKATLAMDYNAGIEMTYGHTGAYDYDKQAEATVYAFERAGITMNVDGRPFGRLVRGYI